MIVTFKAQHFPAACCCYKGLRRAPRSKWTRASAPPLLLVSRIPASLYSRAAAQSRLVSKCSHLPSVVLPEDAGPFTHPQFWPLPSQLSGQCAVLGLQLTEGQSIHQAHVEVSPFSCSCCLTPEHRTYPVFLLLAGRSTNTSNLVMAANRTWKVLKQNKVCLSDAEVREEMVSDKDKLKKTCRYTTAL